MDLLYQFIRDLVGAEVMGLLGYKDNSFAKIRARKARLEITGISKLYFAKIWKIYGIQEGILQKIHTSKVKK